MATQVVVPVRAKHGKGLARTSLSICEDGGVVAMQHLLDVLLHKSEQLILLGVLIKHFVVLGFYHVLSIGDAYSLVNQKSMVNK